jgi:hypothetical protein
MADAAADFFQAFRMGKLVHFRIHVAADAVLTLVDRLGIKLKINVHRDCPALSYGRQIGIGMAGFAFFVGLTPGRRY